MVHALIVSYSPIISVFMESIRNKIGRHTRMAFGGCDGDFHPLHIHALQDSNDIRSSAYGTRFMHQIAVAWA